MQRVAIRAANKVLKSLELNQCLQTTRVFEKEEGRGKALCLFPESASEGWPEAAWVVLHSTLPAPHEKERKGRKVAFLSLF